MQNFIDRFSSRTPKEPIKRPVIGPAFNRPVISIPASNNFEQALKQEQELSRTLQRRLVELEMTPPPPREVVTVPVCLPLPVASTSSEWRVRLEEVQKRQLEKIIGRGGINITICL